MDTHSDQPTTGLRIADASDDLEHRVARLEADNARFRALLLGAERWMPLNEAARRLGVSRHTLHSRLRRGHDIPARKFLGLWEIDPTWVAAQCATRNIPTTSKD